MANPELIVSGSLTAECGKMALRSLLAASQRPTAVLCSKDVIAFGILAEARDCGLFTGTAPLSPEGKTVAKGDAAGQARRWLACRAPRQSAECPSRCKSWGRPCREECSPGTCTWPTRMNSLR